MKVTHKDQALPYESGLDNLVGSLDREKGLYMASDTDYPGRYSRWDIGFDRPPVEIIGHAQKTVFRALSERGVRILDLVAGFFARHADPAFTPARQDDATLVCTIKPAQKVFSEEE